MWKIKHAFSTHERQYIRTWCSYIWQPAQAQQLLFAAESGRASMKREASKRLLWFSGHCFESVASELVSECGHGQRRLTAYNWGLEGTVCQRAKPWSWKLFCFSPNRGAQFVLCQYFANCSLCQKVTKMERNPEHFAQISYTQFFSEHHQEQRKCKHGILKVSDKIKKLACRRPITDIYCVLCVWLGMDG